jgi:hypothetical protein
MKKMGQLLLLILLTLSILYTPVPTNATPALRIYLDPQNYIYTIKNATIGTRFNATVWVGSDTYPFKLMTWQVYITWNQDLINVTRIWGETTGSWTYRAWPNDNFGGRSWDPGYVFYAKGGGTIGNPYFYNLGPESAAIKIADTLVAEATISTPKKLCAIEFEIKKIPEEGQTLSCVLGINNTKTYLLDKNGKISGVTIHDGYYEISAPGVQYKLTIKAAEGGTTDPPPGVYTYSKGKIANVTAIPYSGFEFSYWKLNGTIRTENPIQIVMTANFELTPFFIELPLNVTRLYVDPKEIIDPTMTPSSTFKINVTVDDVANMLTCEFNLTYNPDVLEWMGINIFKVFGKLPTTQVNIDDEAGFIFIKLIYKEPISTTTPIALVGLTFHVEALGTSKLDLHDTKLLNPEGESIEHEAIDGFFMSLIRDIAITKITLSRSWAYRGWPVEITLTVKNLGNISETFTVKAYYDNTLIGETTVSGLPPNTEMNVTIIWDTSSIGGGIYTIKGEATTVPYEIDTSNNIYIDGTIEIVTVLRDVAITGIFVEYDWAYKGWIVDVNVTVKNLGEVHETFTVSAFFDNVLMGTKPVENLPPNTQITLVFKWNTSLATPCRNYTLRAEASILPYEYNTDNNIYVDGVVKVRIIGDVNGDGYVDGVDIYLVAKAFGSFPGHPIWNPCADINGDKLVDGLDLWIVAKNFGKGCSR